MADQVVTLRITGDGKAAVEAVRQVDAALGGIGKSGGQGGQQAAAGMNRAAAAANTLSGQLDRTRQTSERTFGSTRKGLESISRQLSGMQQFTKWVSYLGVGAGTLRGIARMADEYTNLASRLRLVSASQEEAARTQEALFDIAQRSRADLAATGDLYVKLAQSTKEMGLSQQQTLRMTETINKAFVVSGASSSEAANAIVQLGQGLAAGALRGDEFNSVAEQAPVIMDMLAKSLNVSRGELRALAAEGKITAQVLVEALGHGAADIDAKFANMQLTISGAFTQLRNAVAQFVGEAGKASGIASTLAIGIRLIAEHLGDLIAVAGAAVVAWLGKLAISLIRSAQLWALNTAEVIAYNVALSAGATNAAKAITAIRAIGASVSTAFGAIGIAVAVIGGLWVAFKRYVDGQREAAEAADAAVKSYIDSARAADDMTQSMRESGVVSVSLASQIETYGHAMTAQAAAAAVLTQRQAELQAVQQQLAGTPVGWERERLQQRADALADSIANLAGQMDASRASVNGLGADIAQRFTPAVQGAIDKLNSFDPAVLLARLPAAAAALKAGIAGVLDADAGFRSQLAGMKTQADAAQAAIDDANKSARQKAQDLQESILAQAEAAGIQGAALDALRVQTDGYVETLVRQDKAQRKTTDSTRAATDAVQDYLDRLAEANRYHGLSSTDLERAKLNDRTDMTPGQRAQATVQLDVQDELDAQQAATQARADALKQLQDMAAASAEKLADVRAALSGVTRQQQELTKANQAAKAVWIAAGGEASKAATAAYRASLASNQAAKEGLDAADHVQDLYQRMQQYEQKSPLEQAIADVAKFKQAIEEAKAGLGGLDESDLPALRRGLEEATHQVQVEFVGATGDALRGLQSLTKQGSKDYAALGAAADTMTAIEAILAVVHQATAGDVYTAIPRMIAMAGTLASLGQSISIAGGTGFSDTAGQRQATQGTGTVLGDATAQSASIANAVEITAKASERLVAINTGMLRALQSLQAAIGAATGMLARGAGDADFSGQNLAVGRNAIGALLQDSNSAIGLPDLLGIFKARSKVTDAGIKILGGTIADLINGDLVRAYQEVQSKSWAFGSTHTKEGTAAVGDAFAKQFQLIIQSIADTVREGAIALGILPAEVEAAIRQYQVAATNISLKGLSAEDQQAALEAVFSAIFDGLAGAVVPSIEQFQRVGEGLGETLVRVATEVQVMQQAVAYLGLTVDETDPERFAQIADGLIQMAGGTEAFIGSMQSFDAAFAPAEYRLQLASDALTSALAQVGLGVPETRDAMWALMQSLDATTVAGREQIATLLRLADTADQYYDALEKRAQELLQAQADYASTVAGLAAEAGTNSLGKSLLEVSQWSAATTQKLNDLAKVTGLAGAKETDLALVRHVALQRMQAAIDALMEQSRSLVDQLSYGGAVEGAANAVAGFGSAMQDAAQKARDSMQLLLGDLSPYSDRQKLEIAKQGLLAGTASREDVLSIGRRLFASGADYKQLFDWVEANGSRAADTSAAAGYRAMQEVAQKTLTKAERYQLADRLANNIADLAAAQNLSFAEVANRLGFDLAQLGGDLGLSDKSLQDYLTVLASDNFGLDDLSGVLRTEVDRLIAAITSASALDANAGTSAADALQALGADLLTAWGLRGANDNSLPDGEPRNLLPYTPFERVPTTVDPALREEVKQLGESIRELTAIVGRHLPAVADNTERGAEESGRVARNLRDLVEQAPRAPRSARPPILPVGA